MHIKLMFILICICVSLRLSSPEWKLQHPNIFQQVMHNECSMPLSSNPCLNAWKEQTSQVLFLHADHCCCHSCSCLSLAFCVLKPLIYSSFLPGTLHLICDERTGAGDNMFPYYGYVKLNFFLLLFLYM